MRVQTRNGHLTVVGEAGDDTWVPAEIAAEMLQRSPATVTRLGKIGAVRMRRILGRVCFAVEDVRALLAERDGEPDGEVR